MKINSLFVALVFCNTYLISVANADELPKPGTLFKDCNICPEMVVLPAGDFIMGTPESELGHQPDETPQHKVTFKKAFAISTFQVMSSEWDAYVQETGVKIKDGDTRPGRACKAGKPSYPQGTRQPAVCMNYYDVQAYVHWIAKKTGKDYRMVSEAEREYAARGGTSGPFPFPFDKEGVYQINKNANPYGDADGYTYTAPAGSYPPNAYGVFDMHGNTYEWVADCWHDSYEGAPADGHAWMDSDSESSLVSLVKADNCESYQIRGNDWIEPAIFSRSGNRNHRSPEILGDWLSFRVIREF